MKPPLNSNSSSAWALRSTLWRLGRLLPVLAALDELRQKPQLSQERPTETNRKKLAKKLLGSERSSLSKSGKLELSRGSPAQQGSRWGPDPPATVADVSNCRDVSKASGHGLRLLSTPKILRVDDGLDDCFKIPWLFFRVFGGDEKLPNYGK